MANRKDQAREYAKLLYIKEGRSNVEIAELVGVSHHTVGRWAAKENWDDLKKSLLLTKEEELRRMYAQLTELNTAILKKPEGERYANSKEADTLVKISSAIRQMETDTSVAQIVDVAQAFVKWVRAFDIDQSKELTRLFEGFIKDRLK